MKKISIFISIVLISLLAVSAVSAADVATDGADLAVEDVQAVDVDATDEIITDSNDISEAIDTNDVSDSADLEDLSADDAVDATNPSVVKANALGADGDGTFTELYNLIRNGGTITLDRNYAYASSDGRNFYDGIEITRNVVINGNGHYISGSNYVRIFDVIGATLTLNNLTLKEGTSERSTYTTGGMFPSTTYYGGAIYSHGQGATVNINGCNITDNHADGNNRYHSGGAIYSTGICHILDSMLVNNTAYNGGAFTIAGGNFTVHGSVIFDNVATNNTFILSDTFGDNGFLSSGSQNLTDNWWGSNKGPEDTIATTTVGTSLAVHDWFILTEILTSVTTVDVDFALYRGGTSQYKVGPARLVKVTTDTALLNTTEAYCPDPFTIEFTTSDDAIITVATDHEELHLKVFAGENKKNITRLDLEIESVVLPNQPVLKVTSDVDGIYNITLGSEIFEVEIVDGEGTYEFEGLDVGKYTIIVSRVDDPVYRTIFRTADFEVKKYQNELTIEADNLNPTFGTDVTITSTFTPVGPTGKITYFVDGSEVGTELDVGQAFVLSGLNAGEHTIVAKYDGDAKYDKSVSNTLVINVAQATLNITVEDVTVNYPNKGTVNVTANKDGKYAITVNDVPYEVTVVDGVGSFDVGEVLVAGEYVIAWNIEESENYTSASGEAKYTVLNAVPIFDIAGSPIIDYGEDNNIELTINDDATGTVSYKVNDEDPVVLDVSELFIVELPNAGQYTVVATYSGDNNYAGAEAEFVFEVLPVDVIVTVVADPVAYPNTGSVILNASAPGTYTVKVGDMEYPAVVTSAGEPVTVDVEDVFAVNSYDISVTAPASTNYNAVDTGKIGTYVVTKAESTIDVSYANGEFTITLDGVNGEKLNETITVEIDGIPVDLAAKTENGVFTFTDEGLSPGKHSIFVVFEGNDNYLGDSDHTSFELDKFDTAVVTVSAETIKEGEEAIVKVTVKDGETGISGTVVVTVDEIDYAVEVTNGEGEYGIKNLPAGTYPISAKFVGNDEYSEATATGELIVKEYNPVIIVITGGDEAALATLIDIDQNLINGKVNVTIDNGEAKEYDVVEGKVNITDVTEGWHNVTVDFLGDEEHPPATATEEVYVGKTLIPTNVILTLADIIYTQEAEAVVILTDVEGNRLSGVVNVTVGDQSKEVTVTNGEGSTKFTGLNAGSYVAVANFESDGTYAAAYATYPLKVEPMLTRIVCRNMTTTAINTTEDGRIGDYFYWTLVDARGNPLAGKKVSIGFNARVYNRTTDANGMARLQINLERDDIYTFAISFLGDENYNASFEVVKIIVNKQTPKMTASNQTYKASASTKTLTATLKSLAGNPIVNNTVKFVVDGKTYKGTTDANGVVKVNVSLTKAGSYAVNVTSTQTAVYSSVTRKITLKLT